MQKKSQSDTTIHPLKLKLKRITISSVGENVKQLELLLLGGNAKLVQQVCKNSSEIP